MDAESDRTTADRVAQLLRHLGIARAHFVQGAAEAAALPECVASLVLVMPVAGEVAPLRALADLGTLPAPPLIVHSDAGPLADHARRVLPAYPGATAVVLPDYSTAIWTDAIADRTAAIAAALLGSLADADQHRPLAPLRPIDPEGEVAGITYRVRGSA